MHKADRRSFVKAGLAVGAVSMVGTGRIGRALAGVTARPDIVAVKGADAFANTAKAIQALGGIGRFVSKGNRVGLLINAPVYWRLEGSYTHQEISLAVAKLCLEAGAKEVVTLPVLAPKYWDSSPLTEKHASVVKAIKPCADKTVATPIPKGIKLKSGNVRTELLDVDVLINLPIAKQHKGTQFTGNLKNMMGGLDHDTCRKFHLGSHLYADLETLCQCIADLNTLRRPNLCVVDATVVLASNGPVGPGDLLRAQKVVAGTDPVAVDTYCAGLHKLKPQDLLILTKAAAAGVGRMDIDKLSVKELEG